MFRRSVKTVRDVLNENSLQRLQQRTEQFQQWQRLWQSCVGQQLAGQSQCISVHDDCIKVSVASSIWITRLRLQEAHIIGYFNQFLEQPATRLEISVAPVQVSGQRGNKRRP